MLVVVGWWWWCVGVGAVVVVGVVGIVVDVGVGVVRLLVEVVERGGVVVGVKVVVDVGVGRPVCVVWLCAGVVVCRWVCQWLRGVVGRVVVGLVRVGVCCRGGLALVVCAVCGVAGAVVAVVVVVG